MKSFIEQLGKSCELVEILSNSQLKGLNHNS